MAGQEGCVTTHWEIRNFSIFRKEKEGPNLRTPFSKGEDIEEGVLGMLNARLYDSHIKFMDYVWDPHLVRKEMSFTSSCGEVLLRENPSNGVFDLPKSALFDENGQSILPNDTMNLCCRRWGRSLRTLVFHFTTVLRSLNHLWTIEKLASSDSHDTYIEKENYKLHVSLKKGENDTWRGKVEKERCAPGYLAPGYLSIVKGTLSVKDFRGHVLDESCNLYNQWICNINISPYNASIALHLELIVALHGRQELSASSQVARETQLKPNSPTNIAEHKNVSGVLGDDLLLMYRESAFSDATLNTEGKSFSAHRTILAARSPVFRAMFEGDETSEGRSGVVEIDDVDSATVDRMLVYLYGDSVGDLAWKEASALYYAADKYAILPLREKCAEFLKAGLAEDNACDVLVLADRHSDQELMTRVVSFILAHEEVVSSAQWGELEKFNPMLCAKITRQLFLKRGKK